MCLLFIFFQYGPFFGFLGIRHKISKIYSISCLETPWNYYDQYHFFGLPMDRFRALTFLKIYYLHVIIQIYLIIPTIYPKKCWNVENNSCHMSQVQRMRTLKDSQAFHKKSKKTEASSRHLGVRIF